MKLIDDLLDFENMLAVHERFDHLSDAAKWLVVEDCGFGPFIVYMESFSRHTINKDTTNTSLTIVFIGYVNYQSPA